MIKKLGIRFDPDAYWGLDSLSNLLIKMGKWKIGILVLWLVAIYATSTSLTCVTEDKIVAFSPLSPNGQVYSFSDVEKIEAGFGDKLFSLSEYKTKGSFYYKVYIDGDEHVFHAPTVNPDIERYEDTYLELEELDKKLTELGIPKKSSSKGYENCDFDKEFVDRFLRIIELRKTK